MYEITNITFITGRNMVVMNMQRCNVSYGEFDKTYKTQQNQNNSPFIIR